MKLTETYTPLKLYTKKRTYNKTISPVYDVICDCCGKSFCEKAWVFERRISLIQKEYCGKCSRPFVSSLAGLKGLYDSEGNMKPNAGRFTKERVLAMTPTEYKIFCEQRRRASKIGHDILRSDPVKYKEHYDKVFKKSKIGYISAGQQELYDTLSKCNSKLKLEHVVEGIACDIVDLQNKIVVEYYGDFWHMNPKKYDPSYFNKATKLTAKEKWDADRKRNFVLRRHGYEVIVIWELDWKSDKQKVLDYISRRSFVKYVAPPSKPIKFRWMTNQTLRKNTLAILTKIDALLEQGWTFGKNTYETT